MFIVETTKSGIQVSDRLEGIKSPRSLPLYGVTFNNVNLHHSDLLGRGKDAVILVTIDRNSQVRIMVHLFIV